MTINDRIIQVREALNLNQTDFAAQLNKVKSVINGIETGKKGPSRNLLIDMANTFDINITWLLTGKGKMFIENEYEEFSAKEAMIIVNALARLNGDKRNKVLDYIKSLYDDED